jgi:hypothetical protein
MVFTHLDTKGAGEGLEIFLLARMDVQGVPSQGETKSSVRNSSPSVSWAVFWNTIRSSWTGL